MDTHVPVTSVVCIYIKMLYPPLYPSTPYTHPHCIDCKYKKIYCKYNEESSTLMKRMKSFRLSEEACKRLEREDNATEFLERLILKRVADKPFESYMIEAIDKIERKLDDLSDPQQGPDPFPDHRRSVGEYE